MKNINDENIEILILAAVIHNFRTHLFTKLHMSLEYVSSYKYLNHKFHPQISTMIKNYIKTRSSIELIFINEL
jgi:hypothetical protein